MTVESDSARFLQALRSAIAWPVGVIFFTAVLLLLLAFRMFHYVGWADHSFEVILQSSLCENEVSKMQNEVRGFIITGDPSFVTKLNDQTAELDGNMAHLQDLVEDNPAQVTRAKDLVAAKDAWLTNVHSLVSRQPLTMTEDAALTVQAKDLMNSVVARFDSFNAVEDELRHKRFNDVLKTKQLLLYAGSALFIALTLTVGQLVRSHFTQLAENYRGALKTIAARNAELEEQKEWFRVTLSSIGDGVIVTNETGRVVFMNGEAEALTGWKQADARLRPLPEIFHIVNEETRAKVEDPVDKVLREKKVVGMANHSILISAQGRECPIEDSAAPIKDGAGKLQGVVLVFHNATDVRRAQKEMRLHSEELEKKVRERTLDLQQTVMELEAFSYTISHDLRSPLRAMQGFAQAIEEDYGGVLDEQGKGYLARISKAAERLDRLIQDLLAYTRIAREETPLVPLDLDQIAREIVAHYPNLEASGAKIEILNPLPKILGREAALTQVLSNLLGNAVKFSRPNSTPEIKIRSETRGDLERLWIEDNGIGIAGRDFDRIFQMFIQVNEPALYGGTGVGLAIVKKAVQSMRGAVGVQSVEGKGSQFWVDLMRA